ncbi:unnamed protein product [Rhizoctonia solani]|uniref:Uncharacterized protein n=1 Tax=Rhizoctonia solani TaxID=456999 RepID=A0A8H3GI28_9AGAM|nr:unnamed protein product [Rhizoctonia solani]
MEGETRHIPAANPARGPAANGVRTEKDQPALPSDKNPATAPRPPTPTTSASRTQRSGPPKASSRSATIDQSMSLATAAQQSAQPAPPPAPASLVPSIPSATVKRTPVHERDAFIQQNTLIEGLQATIKEQEKAIQQKDVEIKHSRELFEHFKSKSAYLESDSYRNEVVSIRRHLQVDELCEPWEINKKFSEIVRKVEDISRDMGEALGSLPAVAKFTTLDLLKLLSRAPENHPLAAAEPTGELDAEDFIDFGCRALINEALFNGVLGPSVFHPGLNSNENQFYCHLYRQVRKEEPQVVAGRWRISTLKVVSANHAYESKNEAFRLCQETLLPFCSRVVESKACSELIQSMVPRFQELFERASEWDHLTKTSVIMLDFHPQFQPPGAPHDTHNTTLEGRRPKPPASKAVLLTSKLGLWSSHADGGGKEPKYSIQTKATMLAAEYFA